MLLPRLILRTKLRLNSTRPNKVNPLAPKNYKLGFLADFLDAQLIGDEEFEIDSLAALENANEISLSFLASG